MRYSKADFDLHRDPGQINHSVTFSVAIFSPLLPEMMFEKQLK